MRQQPPATRVRSKESHELAEPLTAVRGCDEERAERAVPVREAVCDHLGRGIGGRRSDEESGAVPETGSEIGDGVRYFAREEHLSTNSRK